LINRFLQRGAKKNIYQLTGCLNSFSLKFLMYLSI